MRQLLLILSIAFFVTACNGKKEVPLACGGIAAIKCPAGQECVDDPADTCDPAKGGADCPGICKLGSK